MLANVNKHWLFKTIIPICAFKIHDEDNSEVGNTVN